MKSLDQGTYEPGEDLYLVAALVGQYWQ